MRKAILSLVIFLGVFSLYAQDVVDATEGHAVYTQGIIEVNWQNTFEEAVVKAKSENKPILIYFTGSDWCGPCIQLDKKLFHTEKFASFSEDNLVLYTANYPRNRDLVTAETKKVNKQLSKKYNQTSFPTMIVVDGNGNVLGRKNGAYIAEYYYPFFEKMVQNYN